MNRMVPGNFTRKLLMSTNMLQELRGSAEQLDAMDPEMLSEIMVRVPKLMFPPIPASEFAECFGRDDTGGFHYTKACGEARPPFSDGFILEVETQGQAHIRFSGGSHVIVITQSGDYPGDWFLGVFTRPRVAGKNNPGWFVEVLAGLEGDNLAEWVDHLTNPSNLEDMLVSRDLKDPHAQMNYLISLATVTAMRIRHCLNGFSEPGAVVEQATEGRPAPKRRLKKNPNALNYDSYHVIRICEERVAAERKAAVGTHRPPREHLRRGHWRQCKSGKRVWVSSSRVNKGVGGVVDKGYIISKKKEETACLCR